VPLKKLTESERSVLQIAAEGSAIGDIVRRCELGKSAAFRSCFVLLSLGLLEPVLEDVAPETLEPSPAAEPEELIEPCRELIVSQFEKLSAVTEHDLLGIRKDASLDQARDAYDALKAEWAEVRKQTRDEGLLDRVDAIELRLASAFACVRLEIDRRGQADAASEGGEFGRRARIEQLARDARLHVQVKDWNGAVPLLVELVALEPQSAEFQALLGKSMAHVPSMKKNAEQHLLEAVMLAPDDASVRLELARYYLAASNRPRARGEVQAVLAMEPYNTEAQRLAESLRELTPMRKLFNKVFR
jgi:hypothetical protein